MIKIATNLFDKFSPSDKREIEAAVEKAFGRGQIVEIGDYKEKSEGVINLKQTQVFLGDVPIKDVIDSSDSWNKFGELLSTIFDTSNKIYSDSNELEFWISSTKAPFQINIFFSAKKVEEISYRLLLLRDTLLVSKVFDLESASLGKILIVGYDTSDDVWRINYI